MNPQAAWKEKGNSHYLWDFRALETFVSQPQPRQLVSQGLIEELTLAVDEEKEGPKGSWWLSVCQGGQRARLASCVTRLVTSPHGCSMEPAPP